MLENQVEVRQREVVELQSQVKTLGQDESDGRRQVLENKFQELLEPLRSRRNFLVASREGHQFNRDMEDEIVRTSERSLGKRWVFHGRASDGEGEGPDRKWVDGHQKIKSIPGFS